MSPRFLSKSRVGRSWVHAHDVRSAYLVPCCSPTAMLYRLDRCVAPQDYPGIQASVLYDAVAIVSSSHAGNGGGGAGGLGVRIEIVRLRMLGLLHVRYPSRMERR